MKYLISVEMDGKENIDALVKAMEPMKKLPHVTNVSLVRVDDAKATFRSENNKKNLCKTCVHASPSETTVFRGDYYGKRVRYLCAFSGEFESNPATCDGYEKKEETK